MEFNQQKITEAIFKVFFTKEFDHATAQNLSDQVLEKIQEMDIKEDSEWSLSKTGWKRYY